MIFGCVDHRDDRDHLAPHRLLLARRSRRALGRALRHTTTGTSRSSAPSTTFNKDGRCTICGAPEDLERGESRENYAYSFIHGAYPTEEMKDMKFDVIVGNPPYQIGTEGTAHGIDRSTTGSSNRRSRWTRGTS